MKVTHLRNTPNKWVIGLSSLVVGIGIGWFVYKYTQVNNNPTIKLVRQDSANYKFVNPVILDQMPEDKDTPEIQSIKSSLSQYIANAESSNKASDVSLYFRQLDTGKWIGVNTDHLYAPASMLKTVSLVAFLQAAQKKPALYTSNVTINASDINVSASQDHYPSKKSAVLGSTYSAKDLLSYMIEYSDNNATNALTSLAGEDIFNETLADLDLPAIDEHTPTDFISPRMYSRVFRALYNASYLPSTVSESALDLLSKTTFTEGLVAGVPEGITVSHKFGERSLKVKNDNSLASDTVNELHDCGIVYAPNNPYLLCVMTKGNDFSALQGVIKDISQITWESVKRLDTTRG